MLINIRIINRRSTERKHEGFNVPKHLKSSCSAVWIYSGTLDNHGILSIATGARRLIHQWHLHSLQKPLNAHNQLAEGRNGLGQENKIATMMNAFPLTFSVNLLLGKMSHYTSHKF